MQSLVKVISILLFISAFSISEVRANRELCAVTLQSTSSRKAIDSDSVPHKFKTFLTNYFNPYISVGVGFDRAFFMPAFGFRSGRMMLQVSALPQKNNTQLVASTNFDLGKNHIIDQGFVRGLASVTYYRYDLNEPKTSALGLLVGFSSYTWSGRNSLHGKIGVAAKPTVVAFGQIPKNDYQAFVVASIGVNFYAFRLQHFGVGN